MPICLTSLKETLIGSVGSLLVDLGITDEEELLADSTCSKDTKVDEGTAGIPISQVLMKIKQRTKALLKIVPPKI